MSKQGFDKFINKKSPAKVKEEHRQEKRKSKAALRAAGNEMRKLKLEKQRGRTGEDLYDAHKKYGDRTRGAGGTETRGKGQYEDRRSRDAKGSTGQTRTGPGTGSRFTREQQSSLTEGRAAKGPQKINPNFGVKNERYAKTDATDVNGQMPLNKFIAHAGICSRREAAELVKQGQVQVNGDIVFEPAIKVSEADTIKLKDKKLTIQQKLVYFLLNKPKDHITTTKDDKGRKTVLDLFKDIRESHVYPVGRLDRNTTGVLLLTNDGELAQELTHPSFEVKKIYEATLDRPLAKKDAEAIAAGITLEDGDIKADSVGYADPKNKAVIGIEIHSGKNRIVRRIFEHLGYEVKKLDRVMFAGLTKKNVERGKWRYLSEKEIRVLKFMNAGGTKKSKAAAKAAEENALIGEMGEAAADSAKAPAAKRKRITVKKDTPKDHVKRKVATEEQAPGSKTPGRKTTGSNARPKSSADSRPRSGPGPKPGSSSGPRSAAKSGARPATGSGARPRSGTGSGPGKKPTHSVRSIKTHKG